MKLLFLLASSFFTSTVFAASCCVSNTGLPNLMILPADWQQTLSLGHSRVIGDVNPKGQSTFRNRQNKETTQLVRMDLSYAWSYRYQTGISGRYQERSREFSGSENKDSGLSDVGLSHAYMLKNYDRLYVFQTVNVPTARSIYDSEETLAVDAQGSGTYQTSLGLLKIHNYIWGDILWGGEIHHSFPRRFENESNEVVVGAATGASLNIGGGWVPWKSKGRLGMSLSPRFDGPKTVTTNGTETRGKQSLVWDTNLNASYSFTAQYAVGFNYLDQTIFGPASNTLLTRSYTFLFQSRF